MFKFIDKVGVEIEGGWDKNREDLIEDVSLKHEKFKNPKTVCTGELITPQPLSSKEELFAFIKDNWPTDTHSFCGYHIHVSFKNVNLYSQCMSQKFFNGFLEKMEKWAKTYHCTNTRFWERFENKNKYTKREFRPEKQIDGKVKKHNDENRYTMLNYCYGVFKTIENRLFPTFVSADTAISATEAYLDYIEEYLQSNPPDDSERVVEVIDIADFSKVNYRKIDGKLVKVDRAKLTLNPFNYFKSKLRKKNIIIDEKPSKIKKTVLEKILADVVVIKKAIIDKKAGLPQDSDDVFLKADHFAVKVSVPNPLWGKSAYYEKDDV